MVPICLNPLCHAHAEELPPEKAVLNRLIDMDRLLSRDVDVHHFQYLQVAIEFPIRQTAQRIAAPILDPLARSMGDIPNHLPSVFSGQSSNRAGLPVATP
jgi:hypothetical protein